MATTKIGSTGVIFPDASLQATSGVTSVNGKGPGVVQSVIIASTEVVPRGTTVVDFTSIPSWVKRITIMFVGISTNGNANTQIQIGNGSFVTSGYLGAVSSPATTNISTGFLTSNGSSASDVRHGIATITAVTTNSYAMSYVGGYSNTGAIALTGGSVGISGPLDRVRVTTTNGTDVFDAGSINMFYE